MRLAFLSFLFMMSYSLASAAFSLGGFNKPTKFVSGLAELASASIMTVHLTQYTHEYAHYCVAELLYENANATVRYSGIGAMALPGALDFSSKSLSSLGYMIGVQKSLGLVHAAGDAANALAISSMLYLNSKTKSKAIAYIAVGTATNFLCNIISGYYAYLTNSALFTNFGQLKSDFQGMVQAFGPLMPHLYLGTLTFAGVRAFRA